MKHPATQRPENVTKLALLTATALTLLLSAVQVDSAVGDTFKHDVYDYKVLSVDPATQTGTVSIALAYQKTLEGDITLPAKVDYENYAYNVTEIVDRGFINSTNLTALTVSEHIKKIGKGAFAYCYSLASLTIPDSVTDIEESAFYSANSLLNLQLGSGIITIKTDTFSHATNLTTLTIPDTVTTIEGSAFYCLTGLTNLHLSSALTYIGEYAFYEAKSLESLTIPDSVAVIERGAFYGAINLSNLIIGSGVVSIKNMAFYFVTVPGAYFKGNAPIMEPTVFYKKPTLYYIEGKQGWTSPTWNEYNTAIWVPDESLKVSFEFQNGRLILTYGAGRLQESANLADWSVVDESGHYEVEVSSNGNRFYRAVQ